MRSLIAIITASCFFLACYNYTPIPATSARVSSAVRITLDRSAYSQTFGRLGSAVTGLEGDVLVVDDSSVTVAVTDVMRGTDDDQQVHGERVTVPRQSIASIEWRRVDVLRSVAVTGAIAGAAVWVASLVGHGAVNQVRQKSPSGQQ